MSDKTSYEDALKLEHHQAIGFQLDSVGIQWLTEEENHARRIRVSITIYSLRDFSAFCKSIISEARKYFNNEYETNVCRMRVYLVWRKETDYGSSTDVVDTIVNDHNQIIDIYNNLINADWIKER